MTKAGPVPCTQILRDYQVERLAGSVGGREAEYPLRTGIPEGDAAVAIGGDDRVGGAVQQGFT
jgi:hypothetical protein